MARSSASKAFRVSQFLAWMERKLMNYHYDKIREDVAFRRDLAERAGTGFEIPKPSIVPNVEDVPSSADEVKLGAA
jgi:hypothetical protein